MIRAAKPQELSFLSPRDEAAVRILSLLSAYGDAPGIVSFYTDDAGGAAAVMDGGAVVSGAGENGAEWRAFLCMHPDVVSVRADAALVCGFSANAGKAKTGRAMRWEAGDDPETSLLKGSLKREASSLRVSLRREASPRLLYPLLSSCFQEGLPPFESFYVDVSHRMRHGCCRVAAMVEEPLTKGDGTAGDGIAPEPGNGSMPQETGEVLASAMTVAECAGAAIIGAVATRPDCRGRGYATACVRALTETLTAEGRQVWICPKNEAAASLYAHIGFVPCGEWGQIALVRSKKVFAG